MNQVGILVKELCKLHSVSEPAELERLSLGLWASGLPAPPTPPQDPPDPDEDEEEDDGDDDEDLHLEMEEPDIVSKNKVHIIFIFRFIQLLHYFYIKLFKI